MTREGLSEFLNAIDRSSKLRRELVKCKDKESLLRIAANYGFPINAKDLAEDEAAEKISNWFNLSKVSSIKKTKS